MRILYDHLVTLAAAHPERAAIVVCDAAGTAQETVTRAALLEKVANAATYLAHRGLRAGDRVALAFGNSADLLVISWAAWGMGIVTVPLDMKRDTGELREYKIQASKAKFVITQEEFSSAQKNVGETKIQWATGLSHEALILFTSGTTARPKGARLTLANLVVNAEGIIEWLRITEADRFLVLLPLHHINSTTFCLASLLAGATIVLPPLYSNSRFWRQATESAATFTSLVPSIVFDQLHRTQEFEAVKNRLKLSRIQLGSAPVVASDALEFMNKFSIPLYQGYGQTETALRVTGVPMGLSQEQLAGTVAGNSIGTPMPWAQVEVADAEGKILGEGEEGELVVKGPAVMQGYVGDEPAFRDGYFLTGDIGHWKKIGDKRFFYLKGRSKEIIIKGGVNISPVAVENALKKVGADIGQVYVVGVGNARYGEEVGAAVVWRKDTDAGAAMRRLKLTLLIGHEALSAYEIPKYLTALQPKELPVTSTGKVQRTVLRKNLADKMESVFNLLHSADYRFEIISPQSPLAAASHALYNHCWQPLVKSVSEYKKYLGGYLTLGAIDASGRLAGQISFSYADKKMTCVSICSANFNPKPVPTVSESPSAEAVREYLLAGHDPVMNFHTKLGAELVEVTPGGRPEDRSACGYTMFLSYPPAEEIKLDGPVSHQLIRAIRLLAHDVGASVFALSRPGGLAHYLARVL